MDHQLLNDILDFKIGSEDDALTFADRLCRENNWSKAFATRCIEEYKKFIYLASVLDVPVTPSDEIDQVWHLHLTYTQSYWVDLCQTVLKKSLHHGPTKGGSSESSKYKSQYQITLDKYIEVFKASPPADIWPSCHKRFYNAEKFVRLNSADYFLLKRKSLFSMSLAVILPLFLVACVKDSEATFELSALIFLGLVCAYIFYRFLFPKKRKKKKGSGCGAACGNNDGGSGCSGCGGCGG